jgi:hypothetical protein
MNIILDEQTEFSFTPPNWRSNQFMCSLRSFSQNSLFIDIIDVFYSTPQ